MQKAGISVVRLGESTWSSWEPREGQFEFAWMDRVIDRLHQAGIKVILGTPTYSIPPWMYKKHPEILVTRLGGQKATYGMRQNMDITNPDFRRYAERVIRQVVGHYKSHPGIIGYQIDNETTSYGTAGPNVQKAFVDYLREKFGTTVNMNKQWGFTYWGQLVNSWDEMPPADGMINPGYKLEWQRYQQKIATDYLAWQAALVNEYKRPEQFVTQNFVGGVRTDIDQPAISKFLDIAAVNPYHAVQDQEDGWPIALSGDLCRSLKRQNYLITETNAQTIGWDSKEQYPPYDGQLRLECLQPPRKRREHGRLLALAFAALRPGDLLEGRVEPRPRTEPGLQRSQPSRQRVEEDRSETGQLPDARTTSPSCTASIRTTA